MTKVLKFSGLTEMNQNELEKKSVLSYFCGMAGKSIPELAFLLSDVEQKYGRKIATSTDFDALAGAIQENTKNVISASTLKRMWGYVSLCPIPRMATLDILSRYLEFKDFQEYRDDLVKRSIVESGFFSSSFLAVSDLETGKKVQIGWAPNRIVTLSYLGNFTFEVEESLNSKLEAGDRFELSDIMVGYPLYISRILRNGEYTPSYIAGKSGGISILKVL